MSIILQSTYCIEEALHRLYFINKTYRETLAIKMYERVALNTEGIPRIQTVRLENHC